ncbi:reticulon-like protein B17 isoform X2 [Canna indica]|uniref:Reticulon-like protein n=1 Tax=Canna indica TaxID=4628 RepID=A0AAQ3JYT8_9LILI|nr:reticulon-like protein B17 isoform X2 [Canna indica]
MAKLSTRLFSSLLRLLAAAATLCATVVMATSHESTTLFGMTMEAKFQHTPSFKFFVIANAIGFCCSIVALFAQSRSSLLRLVFVIDLFVAMLLTAAIAAAGAFAQLAKKGNSHAGWLPVCGQVPSFCDHVMGAMICGLVGVVTYLLILLHTIHTVFNSFKHLASNLALSSMDSPPPSAPPYTRSSAEPRLRSKPVSRLAPPVFFDNENQVIPFLTTPPSRTKSPFSPSPLHLANHSPVPLQELVLLSPSPHHKPKGRPAAEDGGLEVPAGGTPRRRGKTRATAAAAMGLMGCASSPRNARKARRRLEKEIAREEREMGHQLEDDGGRGRKRRQSKSKVANKERLSIVPFVPPPSPAAEVGNGDRQSNLDGLQEQIVELVMWRNAAKSALWFGLGSMIFLSSTFSRDISFSIISALSHLGLIILGLAFFKDSVPNRQQMKMGSRLQLTEDDFIRSAKIILPVANFALAKAQDIFCGDPLRTLQVAPILLFGAVYGNLITLRRLFATCFFVSFTLPKLYSCYSQQIHKKVESMTIRVQEAWKSCPRKKFIAVSAATMFWNLFSVKSRIFAAFISVVILRYQHQQTEDNGKVAGREEEEQQQPELPSEQGQL